MKIRIIEDYGEVYESGREMEANELINDYIDCLNEIEYSDTIEFLRNDERTSLKFIGDMWGLKYVIVD